MTTSPLLLPPPATLAWLRLALTAACLLALPLPLHALAMGPGMIMVQDIPPGQEVNLRKLGATLFTIVNPADQEQTFNLTTGKPSKSGLTEWEIGYEEIPDPAWCRMEEAVVTIPAKSEKQVGIIINIPDAPENYNRKFMVGVVLRAGNAPGISVGMAICCRVEIETAVNDSLPAVGGAPLATAPGTLTVTGNPGTAVTGVVRLRNNTGRWSKAIIERVPEVYSDKEKQERYNSNGFATHPGDPWLAPKTLAFALKVGEASTLEFAGTIPANATPGKNFEELAFIHLRTDEGRESRTLVRVHCLVVAPEPAKPKTPEAPTKP